MARDGHKVLIRPDGPDSDGFTAITEDNGQTWAIPDKEGVLRATGLTASHWVQRLQEVAAQKARSSMGYEPTSPQIVGVLEEFPGSRITKQPPLPTGDVQF